MKKYLMLLSFVIATNAQATDQSEPIVTDGYAAERVYNLDQLIDKSKIVDGHIPKVHVIGVRMYPGCGFPETLAGSTERDQIRSNGSVSYYEIIAGSRLTTKMGCAVQFDEERVGELMFDTPITLNVKENGYFIYLVTKNRAIKSLIIDFEY